MVRCKDPVSDYDLAITLFTIGNSNHDSQLDESEIAEFYRKEIQFPAPLAEFVAKSMIERGDTNNDNRLSFEGIIIVHVNLIFS